METESHAKLIIFLSFTARGRGDAVSLHFYERRSATNTT